jgi:hypothetical protein
MRGLVRPALDPLRVREFCASASQFLMNGNTMQNHEDYFITHSNHWYIPNKSLVHSEQKEVNSSSANGASGAVHTFQARNRIKVWYHRYSWARGTSDSTSALSVSTPRIS